MNLKRFCTFIVFVFFFNCIDAQTSNILWYKQPAQYFEESLVMGNGKMGASIFSGLPTDTIILNDITLWRGGPVNPNDNPDAYKNLPAVREALAQENYKLADQLNRKIQGKYSNPYSPLGSFYIQVNNQDSIINYRRQLDIGKAVAAMQYQSKGVLFTREYFISHPDKLMVIKLKANKKGALQFDIKFDSPLKFVKSIKQNSLKINGATIGKNNSLGTRFTTIFKIKNVDGKIVKTDSTIGLVGATEAFVYVSIATSFNGFDKDPVSNGKNDDSLASNILANAMVKTYETIKQHHIKDYSNYFNRVNLDLGKSDSTDLQIDERLQRYASGKPDKQLEALYFQFGRYLLISCSRTPKVPANLQGLWNPYLNPPWGSNYTTNINTEENYWMAETGNLSEMHTPLLGFIENLAVTGKATAKNYYGAGGWAACHNSDIWAMSNPVGEGKGSPQWANWNMSGTWLTMHLWDHYSFTQDKKYLKEKAYPLMQGAAQFCLDWLVEDKNGDLITSPSVSPENKYISGDGYKGHTFFGSTCDLALIRECFQNTIKAAETLKVDDVFVAKLKFALAKLHPYQIGNRGNLQEWYYDWEDAEFKHQHQSHLVGLYPGHHISPEATPDLAAACKNVLEQRGDQTTGWSKAWRINLWARLHDGNRAYKMYKELLSYVPPTVRRNYKGGGTYPNLLDAHPPFQIDGNFGGSAAVLEMLVQSTDNQIILLPALPDNWNSGNVKGVCARGGFELEISWEDKKVVYLKIFSKSNGKTSIKFGDKILPIVMRSGEVREVRF
ncbi:MAG: glycoside hydrolase family 95 protein [Chitinophagaceae bacterium]|nr:glycoside hydrolase family 95 protein [Chitinophagaceae bacterium]